MEKVYLWSMALLRRGSTGTAALSPCPRAGGPGPRPAPARSSAALSSGLPGILALLLGPAAFVLPSERLSKPGIGQGEKVDLEEDQVRKDG